MFDIWPGLCILSILGLDRVNAVILGFDRVNPIKKILINYSNKLDPYWNYSISFDLYTFIYSTFCLLTAESLLIFPKKEYVAIN